MADNLPKGFELETGPPAGFVIEEPSPTAKGFPSWLQHQKQIADEALETMKGGARQVSEGAVEDDFFKRARGAGKAALGAAGYVASPIQSALRTAVGRPVQEVTGIPEQYTEFAAGMAIPGVGLTRAPAALRLREPPSVPPSLPRPPDVALGEPPTPMGPPTARTLGDIREAALDALLKPTGTIPAQGKAGSVIRQAIEPRTPPRTPSVDDWMLQPGGPTRPMAPGSPDEWIYQSKAGAPSEEWIRRARTPGDDWTAGLPRVERVPEAPATVEPVPKAVRDLFPGKGEDAVGHLIDLAKSENGHVALGQVMRAVPEAGRPVVQGAALMRLGGGAGAKGPQGLNLVEMVKEYGAIPEASRGMLFGEAGKAGVRTHMDSVLADYNKIVGLNAKEGGAIQQPLDLVASLLKQGNYGTIGHLLIRGAFGPHHAATIAQASRAALNLLQKGRTPATIAALSIAMRNLENTIGSAQAAEVSRLDPSIPDEKGIGSWTGITRLGPKFKLPYEKMRQSTNVEDRSRAQPPAAGIADFLAGRFMPNEEYKRRMQGNLLMDPMAISAGALDLSQLQSMTRRR